MSVPNSLETLAEVVKWLGGETAADCAFVTEITEQKQIIHASFGPALPNHLQHEMPLDYSICQHVVAMNYPLIIDDALTHPLMKNNLAVSELGLGAYAGVPLIAPSGSHFGAICAAHMKSKRWAEEHVAALLMAAERAKYLLF